MKVKEDSVVVVSSPLLLDDLYIHIDIWISVTIITHITERQDTAMY